MIEAIKDINVVYEKDVVLKTTDDQDVYSEGNAEDNVFVHPYIIKEAEDEDIEWIASKMIKENGDVISDEVFNQRTGMDRLDFFMAYCEELQEVGQLIVIKDKFNKILAFTDFWLVDKISKDKIKNGELKGFMPSKISEGDCACIRSVYVVNNNEIDSQVLIEVTKYLFEKHSNIKTFSGYHFDKEKRWVDIEMNMNTVTKSVINVYHLMEQIHMKNIMFSPIIKKEKMLCHIISDEVIPGESQKKMLQQVEQDMRNSLSQERIVKLEMGLGKSFLESLSLEMEKQRKFYNAKGYTVEFDIAVGDKTKVGMILGDGTIGIDKVLVFESDGGNFIQIEGIIMA